MKPSEDETPRVYQEASLREKIMALTNAYKKAYHESKQMESSNEESADTQANEG